MSIAERCAPLDCPGVEMASLNVGSVNLGDAVYFNPAPDVEYCSRQITERHIIPEFEVFEIGMINNILMLEDKIKFQKPMLFNIVLGHRGSTPATVDALIALRSMIPHATPYGELPILAERISILSLLPSLWGPVKCESALKIVII